jgi:hypothetical protein
MSFISSVALLGRSCCHFFTLSTPEFIDSGSSLTWFFEEIELKVVDFGNFEF